MEKLRAGVIGCGGRGTAHALGYSLAAGVELAACADTHRPAAARVAERFGIPRTYADYREMLARERLDVVSIALWPALHSDAVMACLDAPTPPRLINAEKPMAPTFGESRRMHEACERAGVMLTFSHQRRFGPAFVLARNLLKNGAVGRLRHLEAYCSNLFDWGTHWFDMMLFYNDEQPVDWVMGQVDCAEERLVFGVPVDTAGLSYFKWRNGVTGLLVTGANPGGGCQNRIKGEAGVIEVTWQGVHVLREGHRRETPAVTGSDLPGGDTSRYILDAVDCLRSGRESILCSRNALRATELIFATQESARSRRKVLLPLDIEDAPLLDLIERGEIVIPDWPAFLTEEEEDAGFELLFNGRDMAGWQLPDATDDWRAVRGLIQCGGDAPGSVLRSHAEFADFVLCLSWRQRTNRGRSAVRLRTPGCGAESATGIEVTLADDRGDPPSVDTTGAINGAVAPTASAVRGASSWNDLDIVCQGQNVRVSVNGEEISRCDLSHLPAPPGPGDAGRIELVDCGHPTDFRDLRIRRLGPGR